MLVSTYYRPRILTQIGGNPHGAIEANAGTGKTFTIEHLVLDLLVSGVCGIDETLVVTFTEKATAELRVRIRRAIEKILFGDSGPDPGNAAAVLLDEAAHKRLENALHSFDRASIFTIHGFCHRVLTDFAFQSGTRMELRLTDARGAFHQAFREELRDRLAADRLTRPLLDRWLSGSDPDQTRGNTPRELENLLFEAYRRGYLESSGRGERERAAQRLIETYDRGFLILAYERSGLKPNDVDSACRSITDLGLLIRDSGGSAETLLEPLSQFETKPLVRPVISSGKPQSGLSFPARTREFVSNLQTAVAAAKSWEWKLVDLFLPPISGRLERDKSESGLIDYDDMLNWVWRALKEPRGDALVQALRRRFRCCLVDEFQDTDDLQWQIFRRIFVASEAGNRLYVVGDPKQAIYAFRGADVFAYLKAREELTASAGPPLQLIENYRSTSDLIDACNHILDQNVPDPLFDGDIRYDQPVKCGRPERTATGPDGNPITPVILMRYQRSDGKNASVPEIRRALGLHIAAQLRRILFDDAHRIRIEDRDRQPKLVKASDIYVLTRTRQESAEIGGYLREAAVPFAFYKQEGLFQTSEAYYVLDVLRAIAQPQLRSRRLKAWVSPFFGIPLRELALMGEVPPAHPLNERLYEWKQIAERGQFAQLFDRLLYGSGLVNRELFLTGDQRPLTNYLHIFEILLAAALSHRLGLAQLVALLDDYINERATPEIEDGNTQRLVSGTDAVSVITVHMSKGLEADVVVLFGGFGRIPDHRKLVVYHDRNREVRFAIGKASRELINDRLKEEERGEDQRLLYVALTRARARLYLPVLPEGSTGKIQGYYAQLNRRLCAILSEPKPSTSRLFAVQDVAQPGELKTDTDRWIRRAKLWSPPAGLLEDKAESEGAFRNLRRSHRPLVMRSYTSLRRLEQAEQDSDTSKEWDIPEDEFKRDLDAAAEESDLPGGREVGLFLHEALEAVAMESFAGAPGLDAWRARADVAAVFRAAMRRHQVSEPWFERGTQAVFHALGAPILLPGGRVVGPLHRCRCVREMEFVYPIPAAGHPLLKAAAARGEWTVERGYLKGFVDLIFEHDGLVYFADWKSDRLADWDAADIERHVNKHYLSQVRIYSIGVIRLLQIRNRDDYERRFGGLLYIFLRGLDGGGARGVYFHRPAWSDICAYEAGLMREPPETADE